MSKTAEERLKQSPSHFINRAIEMIKDADINIGLYNGIVSLLQYAKESDEYAKLKTSELALTQVPVGDDTPLSRCLKRISELEKEKDEALRLLNDALKLIHSLPDLLHDSLGETIEGNEYTIAPYDPLGGDFWITHNKVGSGEPLKQWIKSEIDKALS